MSDQNLTKITAFWHRFGPASKAVLLGFAGGVVTLFVHNDYVETAVATTGLAEIIPAAAPPLGATARILIAMAIGLFIAAIALLAFTRMTRDDVRDGREWSDEDIHTDDDAQDEWEDKKQGGIVSRLRRFLPGSSDDDIRDLEDLPRLRRADTHPDAPARRPLLANSELGDDRPLVVHGALPEQALEEIIPGEVAEQHEAMDEAATYPETEMADAVDMLELNDIVEQGGDDLAPSDTLVTSADTRVLDEEEHELENISEVESHHAMQSVPSFIDGSIKARTLDALSTAELIDRLEQGLARLRARQGLHAEISAPDAITASAGTDTASDAEGYVAGSQEKITANRAHSKRPTLEDNLKAHSVEQQADEMDAALEAALATLQAMTERQRNAS